MPDRRSTNANPPSYCSTSNPAASKESHRFTHVGNGQERRCHIAAAHTLVQPTDTNAAYLDLVMTLQRRDHRFVAVLPRSSSTPYGDRRSVRI